MLSFSSLDKIDYSLLGGLLSLAALMLLWNIINSVRLARVNRKLENVESELEKKALELDKIRKERAESIVEKPSAMESAPVARPEEGGIEIVESGVTVQSVNTGAMAPAAEASGVEISVEAPQPPPIDAAIRQASEPAVSASEPQIEIVSSGYYEKTERPQVGVDMTLEAPVVAAPDFSAAEPSVPQSENPNIEIVSPKLDSGQVPQEPIAARRLEVEPDLEIDASAGRPDVETAKANLSVVGLEKPPKPEPEPSLEQKMMDQFERTSMSEVRIQMFNRLRKNAEFRIVSEGLKKAIEDRASSVIVDMAEVFFVYPQEAAELGRLLEELKKLGTSVRFAEVSSELGEILKSSGLKVDFVKVAEAKRGS